MSEQRHAEVQLPDFVGVKEIAAGLKCTVRQVKRWRTLPDPLPTHRSQLGLVIAWRDECLAWLLRHGHARVVVTLGGPSTPIDLDRSTT